MRILSKPGFTLLELLAVIAMVGIAAMLVLPYFSNAHVHSRRTSCASNLNQLAKAMFMYADVPANGVFPCASKDPDKADPMASLGLLYNKYVADPKVFSCPSKPVPPSALAAIVPGGPVVSSYGYDPNHGPNDAIAAIAADFKGTGSNSDNHGTDAGQNMMIGAGTIEFIEKPSRFLGNDANGTMRQDADIFSLNPELPRDLDGFIRQK